MPTVVSEVEKSMKALRAAAAVALALVLAACEPAEESPQSAGPAAELEATEAMHVAAGMVYDVWIALEEDSSPSGLRRDVLDLDTQIAILDEARAVLAAAPETECTSPYGAIVDESAALLSAALTARGRGETMATPDLDRAEELIAFGANWMAEVDCLE